MFDQATFAKWQDWSKRDDACTRLFVPSDIRQMLGEIERLRNAVDRLVLQVERAPAEAKAIEADIARRKALGEF